MMLSNISVDPQYDSRSWEFILIEFKHYFTLALAKFESIDYAVEISLQVCSGFNVMLFL